MSKIQAVDGLAAVFGIASAITGIGAILAIPLGIALKLTEDHVRVQTRIRELTSLDQASYVAAVIGLVTLPGAIGLALAWRKGRRIERVSLAAMAARLSIMGLVCDGLLLAALLSLLGYRWMTWG
jgi:hypothetical protein